MSKGPDWHTPAMAEDERLLSPWPRFTLKRLAATLIIVLVYAWGLRGTEIRPAGLVAGVPQMADFVRRLLPPAWKTVDTPIAISGVVLPFGARVPPIGLRVAVPEIALAIVETLQMALVGTSLAVVLSLPFGLLAARNVSPHRFVYEATRLLLNMIRAVPEIIVALLFVAAVGLGPFSGVLALAIATIGYLGKLYAEAIEAVDPQQVLAVSATGASPVQTFMYGVVPQALPLMSSYSLLVFEANVRTATILGIVGAGGVGFVLNKYTALLQYQYLMGAVLLLMAAVTVIDRISDAIRRRIT